MTRLPGTPRAALVLLGLLALDVPSTSSLTSPLASPLAAQDRTAVFAGGCFWGIEAVFEHVKGVRTAVSGYAGGIFPDPTYELVSAGISGHAEAVRVTYDPAQVSYAELLAVFFNAHDPTQLDRQGPDVGSQYRSAVFFADEEQEGEALAAIARLTAERAFRREIVTEVTPLETFYLAEAYHQDYLIHHMDQPYIVINDLPKLDDLKRAFPALYR